MNQQVAHPARIAQENQYLANENESLRKYAQAAQSAPSAEQEGTINSLIKKNVALEQYLAARSGVPAQDQYQQADPVTESEIQSGNYNNVAQPQAGSDIPVQDNPEYDKQLLAYIDAKQGLNNGQ